MKKNYLAILLGALAALATFTSCTDAFRASGRAISTCIMTISTPGAIS